MCYLHYKSHKHGHSVWGVYRSGHIHVMYYVLPGLRLATNPKAIPIHVVLYFYMSGFLSYVIHVTSTCRKGVDRIHVASYEGVMHVRFVMISTYSLQV